MEVLPLDYRRDEGSIAPIGDVQLHIAAAEFAGKYLSDGFDPNLFQKAWIARDGNRILGISGMVWNRVDIPVFRSIDESATLALANRMDSFLADNGRRGESCFLFLSERETVEQRCPNREKILQLFNAVPAERYVVRVR